MKRLRDDRGATDPVLAEAARLLRAREPLAEDAVRRARVRARLRRRRGAPRAAGWVRAAVALLLVFSVAAASAMIGKVAQTIRAHMQEARVARQQERERAHAHGHRATPATAPLPAESPTPPTPSTPPEPATAPTPPAPTTAPTSAAPPTAPAPATAPAPTAALVTTAPIAATRPAPPAPHHAAPPPVAPAAVAAPDAISDQSRLVADAVRALRHEHDPARAATILERYFARYPDGVAVEDALALALEATIGRDPPRAAGFATRYLARYPSGRWSALAHRALAP